MSLLLSQFLAYLMVLWGVLSGTVGDWLETEHIVVDNAAAIILSYPTDFSSSAESGEFISLSDIIEKSLGKFDDGEFTADNEETVDLVTADPSIKLDESIINIYCEQKLAGNKRTMSGTGFFINDRGVILTNAHVGQYLLLEKITEAGAVDCYIRGGTIAEAIYEVNLLYLSPSWLINHATLINDNEPKGTGENDFALLYVNASTNGSKLPSFFPYISVATNPLSKKYEGRSVIVAGYPKTESDYRQRQMATTSITKLYTFKSGYADIFSLEASDLGHHGISGAPVIDYLGRAVGMITTKDAGTTILNAITIAHIDRAIKEETDFDLMSVIGGDLKSRADVFNATLAPLLKEILARSLSQ